MSPHRPPRKQNGVALAVALILLVVLTLLALSGVRLSTMELRMSVNDQIRMEAFEEAQSLVDSTVRSFSNTPVLAQGTTICARATQAGDPPPACTDVRVTLPTGYASWLTTQGQSNDDLALQYVNVIISGIPPLNAKPPVGTGFSITDFNAAYLRVQGQLNKNSLNLGAAQINEGIAVVYAAPGDVVVDTNLNALTGT